MHARTKLVAALSAALLLAGQALNASADLPPRLTYLDCPEVSAVAAVVGGAPLSSPDRSDACSYFYPEITFLLAGMTLAELRSGAEKDGHTVVDAPEAGEGAFYYESDEGAQLYLERDGTAVGVSSADLSGEILVGLGGLAGDAISISPEPTPAAAFEATCPTGGQVSSALGVELKLDAAGPSSCKYRSGDAWLEYTVSAFGKVTQQRGYYELLWRGLSAQFGFADFGGLGPGAYMHGDASPLTVNWQHAEGVVIGVTGWYGPDELRHAAVLFNAVQSGDSTPSKPGLPSTGV